MKHTVLLILALVMAGILLFAADYKNNDQPAVTAGPPDDMVKEGRTSYSMEERENTYVLFEKDGHRIYPPEPMEITETWEEGYFPQLNTPDPSSPYVTLCTTMGDIKMVLYPEAAPLAVKNFIQHCQEGFYDGLKFHRIAKDFMIQSGDPTGTGQGGESIYGTPFRDEVNDHLHHFRGAVAQASYGTYMNGSQFYIIQGDQFKKTYREEKLDKYRMQMLINKSSTEVYTRAYDYLFYEDPPEEEFRQKLAVWTNEANEKLRSGYHPDIYIDRAMTIYPRIGGSPHLDYSDTVFGQVVEGMDVVDAINGLGIEDESVVIQSVLLENEPVYDNNGMK